MADKEQTTDAHRREAERRSETDDPTRNSGRQLDDNQDDRGRDANDPARPSTNNEPQETSR